MVHEAAIVSGDDGVRTTIREWLTAMDNWDVSFEADGTDCVAVQLAERIPDLAFIDSRISGACPLEVARSVPEVDVVVLSEDERLACRAFEAGVLDLIVLPVEESRLERTMTRYLRLHRDALRIASDLDSDITAAPSSKVVVWEDGHGRFIDFDDIVWIDALGNYVKVHTREHTWYLREQIGALSARLDSKRFLRIHRSTIVNVDHIEELLPASHADLILRLDTGETVKMSRFYRKRVNGVIGKV